MEYAKIKVSGNQIQVLESVPLTTGVVGGTVAVQFDGSWEDLKPTLVWRGSGRTVCDPRCTGIIPAQVLTEPNRSLFVGVYGTKDQTATPTLWADLGMIREGADPGGESATDPVLPTWAQIPEYLEAELQKAKESGAFHGPRGEKGDTGPQGPQGPQGEPGEVNIDDASVAAGSAWSGKHVIDMLCPDFTERGAVAVCEPVAGYPLQIMTEIRPVQGGSGDPSPQNIRPISGYTGCKLYLSGRNLLPPISQPVTYNGITFTPRADGSAVLNGTATENASIFISKVHIQAGETYTLSGCVGGSGRTYQLYIEDKNIKLYAPTPLYQGATGTASSSGLSSVRFIVYGGTTVSDLVIRPQLEVGTAPTEFEPYKGKEFTAAFGQTVYGGSLDWKTGTLTVDRAGIVLDGSEQMNLSGANFNYRVSISLPGLGAMDYTATAISSHYAYNKTVFSDTADDVGFVASGDRIYIRFGSAGTVTTVDACRAYLAQQHAAGTPVQIVYKLATPTTIQLAPQEILALSGTNTLYSNTGDTTVSGRADPAAVIEKLTNAIIALGGNV